ncbi:MAG: arginine--tRNA ligase [Planctomycetota bacterium]
MDLEDLKQQVARAIHARDGIDPELILKGFEAPREREHGDIALPCFILSRRLKKNPAAIAADYAIHLSAVIPAPATVAAVGPYLNFHLPAAFKARDILAAVTAGGDRYGSDAAGTGRTVVIDFSAPNIAKPFGLGHLRSTVIGNALAAIHVFQGWRVVRVNHLGDWGKQFGLLDVAFARWGSEAALLADPIRHLYELYVRINREVEGGDTVLDEEGRQAFRDLEQGDAARRARWARFRELSIREFKRVYERLDIAFDSYDGEAFFEDKMDATLARLRDKNLLVTSEGAQVVDLSDEGLGYPIIQKTNGSTTYLTRDLATAEYRHATYGFDRMLYVVGQPQELHFKQVFAILRRMGYGWVDRCAHVAFGYIKGMSTRKGTIVFLDDVLDEARERVKRRMQALAVQKVAAADEEAVAEAIGITAVLFSDMKSRRIKDIEFDWDRLLNLQGDTGPYLQNALARICGIFRKAEVAPAGDDAAWDCLEDPHAQALIAAVAAFPAAVAESERLNEPSLITSHLLGLAKSFHAGYNELKVKGSDEATARARLRLFAAVERVFRTGFGLLGFKVLEEM